MKKAMFENLKVVKLAILTAVIATGALSETNAQASDLCNRLANESPQVCSPEKAALKILTERAKADPKLLEDPQFNKEITDRLSDAGVCAGQFALVCWEVVDQENKK